MKEVLKEITFLIKNGKTSSEPQLVGQKVFFLSFVTAESLSEAVEEFMKFIHGDDPIKDYHGNTNYVFVIPDGYYDENEDQDIQEGVLCSVYSKIGLIYDVNKIEFHSN